MKFEIKTSWEIWNERRKEFTPDEKWILLTDEVKNKLNIEY